MMHLHKCINSKFLDLTIHRSNNIFAILYCFNNFCSCSNNICNKLFLYKYIHVSTWFCHYNASSQYHKVYCIYTCMWRYIVLLLNCWMSRMSFLLAIISPILKSGNKSQNWFIFWNWNSGSSNVTCKYVL